MGYTSTTRSLWSWSLHEVLRAFERDSLRCALLATPGLSAVRVFIKDGFEMRGDAPGMVPVLAAAHAAGLTGEQTAFF